MGEKEQPEVEVEVEAEAEAASAPAPAPTHERLEDPVETEASPEERSRGWAPPKRGWRVTVLIIVLAVAGALVALYAWELPPFTRSVQSTDNAYVRGQTTVISPQVNGYVVDVLVQDYQQVKAGEV